MFNQRLTHTVFIGLISAAVFLTSGCGSEKSSQQKDALIPAGGANPVGGGVADPLGGPGNSPQPATSGSLAVGQDAKLGPLVTSQGRTVYRFDKDTASPPKSNCDGQCAEAWPPVPSGGSGAAAPTGIDAKALGEVKRADGTSQLTVSGWPAYFYAQDAAPGDTKGQGLQGVWFGMAPDGKPAGKDAGQQGNSSQGGQQNSDQGSQQPPGKEGKEPSQNDKGKSHGRGRGGGLTIVIKQVVGGIVASSNGRSLYQNGSGRNQSACRRGCGKDWLPAGAVDLDQVKGIDRRLIGQMRLADNSLQLTINGQPMYFFAGDSKTGDMNGQGRDGCWSTVSPQGQPSMNMK